LLCFFDEACIGGSFLEFIFAVYYLLNYFTKTVPKQALFTKELTQAHGLRERIVSR